MTRDEQIDWLCRLIADLNNGVIFTPWKKEFTEALTGILEQEPCKDAISRQFMYKLGATCIAARDKNGKLIALGAIEELPPVAPQQAGHCKECTDCVLDKIRAEIEQAADKQFQIAMGVADLNERYTHLQMENAYRYSLNIIDKYKAESEVEE